MKYERALRATKLIDNINKINEYAEYITEWITQSLDTENEEYEVLNELSEEIEKVFERKIRTLQENAEPLMDYETALQAAELIFTKNKVEKYRDYVLSSFAEFAKLEGDFSSIFEKVFRETSQVFEKNTQEIMDSIEKLPDPAETKSKRKNDIKDEDEDYFIL